LNKEQLGVVGGIAWTSFVLWFYCSILYLQQDCLVGFGGNILGAEKAMSSKGILGKKHSPNMRNMGTD
jgi:hypothetical protein